MLDDFLKLPHRNSRKYLYPFSDKSTGVQKGKWHPSYLEVVIICGFITGGRKEFVQSRSYLEKPDSWSK